MRGSQRGDVHESGGGDLLVHRDPRAPLHVREAEFQLTLDATVTVAASRAPAQASTRPVPLRLDGIQEQAGDGPCLEAAWQQVLICIDDTRTEERWPPLHRSGPRVLDRQHAVRATAARRALLGRLTLYALDLLPSTSARRRTW
jgi:hypothetical protein